MSNTLLLLLLLLLYCDNYVRCLIYHLLNLLACNTHVTELIIQHIYFFLNGELVFHMPIKQKSKFNK